MGARKWLDRYGAPVGILAALGIGTWLIMPTITERRRISRLEPATQRAYRTLLRLMSNRGIRIHTGQTKRTDAQQARLVASGRSGTTRSWHLLGRAIDAYPYDPNTGKPDMKGRRVDLFRIMHDTGAALGFRNLAFKDDGAKRYIRTNKGNVWDAGHMSFRQGQTFAQAQAAQRRIA